jgi:cellulose synthase/poly-beta-1,6-N-acetylglucosamine synthase-like glycosyltransferase
MPTPPSIDIVVIGLNSAKTLTACLESITSSSYPRETVSVYYVDGGSTDGSLSIAEYLGCECLLVQASSPTPGSQRNAGWQRGSAEFIQFLDSDTIMDPDWLQKAVSALSMEGVGAACGDRRELNPQESLFNWIGDLEWNGKPGETEAFGGDVLISRKALEATGGYDPDLIAGEDPELSYRIRRSGYKILKLAEPMTKHDLAMHTLKQYWKRAFRSGHAYAEVHHRYRDFWNLEVKRIAFRALPVIIGIAMLPLAFHVPWLFLAPLVGGMVMLRPRISLVGRFQAALGISRREARIYAWHASLVVLPQFFGMLRFHLGRCLSKPLTNKRLMSKKTVQVAG